jgi:hypothetical protein
MRGHIYLAVDNLEEYFQRVSHQARASISRPIETQPWGERSFYCCDPFGNNLCFVDAATIFTGDSAVLVLLGEHVTRDEDLRARFPAADLKFSDEHLHSLLGLLGSRSNRF